MNGQYHSAEHNFPRLVKLPSAAAHVFSPRHRGSGRSHWLLLLLAKSSEKGTRVGLRQAVFVHLFMGTHNPAQEQACMSVLGAYTEVKECRVLSGDPRRGGSGKLCAICLNRAGKYNFFYFYYNL